MELSHQMRKRNAVLRATWLPRLQNEEADALTNADYRHFSAERRIPVSLDKLKFGVLNELMEAGVTYHDEVSALRERQRLQREATSLVKEADPQPARAGWPAQKRRKRAGATLRDREPW